MPRTQSKFYHKVQCERCKGNGELNYGVDAVMIRACRHCDGYGSKYVPLSTTAIRKLIEAADDAIGSVTDGLKTTQLHYASERVKLFLRAGE